MYDFEAEALTRLTDDPFADLQPAWSPDGRVVAFVTDRFSSDLEQLKFGDYRLALYDIDARTIRAVPSIPDAKNINPQWSADGSSLYFLSDRLGVTNVYRLALATNELYQLTNLYTGITGRHHGPEPRVDLRRSLRPHRVFRVREG